MVPEVAAKRLGLLKEAVSGISRVLVLTYLDDPIAALHEPRRCRVPQCVRNDLAAFGRQAGKLHCPCESGSACR